MAPRNGRPTQFFECIKGGSPLTDGIFETGAYRVPSKSQNSTVLVKVVHLVPNVQTLAGYAVGTICMAPTTILNFDTVHKTKYLFSPSSCFDIFIQGQVATGTTSYISYF